MCRGKSAAISGVRLRAKLRRQVNIRLCMRAMLGSTLTNEKWIKCHGQI